MKLQVNGEERAFSGGLTLAALLEQLGMRADRVAVELNREIVAREQWSVGNSSGQASIQVGTK